MGIHMPLQPLVQIVQQVHIPLQVQRRAQPSAVVTREQVVQVMGLVARVKPLRIIIVLTPTPVAFLIMEVGMLDQDLVAIFQDLVAIVLYSWGAI